MTEYALIPAARVTPEVQRAAFLAARVAAKHLGILQPEVWWFLPAEWCGGAYPRVVPQIANDSGHGVYGWTDPRTPDRIYLRPDIPDVVETALHECRHVWQFARPLDDRPSFDDEEADAQDWARGALSLPIT